MTKAACNPNDETVPLPGGSGAGATGLVAKSEARNPNSETSPKSEARRPKSSHRRGVALELAGPRRPGFGVRLSGLFRSSAFGFRFYEPSPARRKLGLALCLALLALAWVASAQPATNEVKWSINLGQWPRGRKDSSPAVAPDGTIYIGAMDHKLYAVSTNGVLLWTVTTGSEIRSTPAIGPDGTLYFGSRDRHLYAVTAEGKLRWRFATGWWVDSSPALSPDGTISFGSWDGKFYALTPAGALKWTFTTGGPVFSSPAVAADGTLYFGSNDGRFRALTPEGRERWALPTGAAIISSPALRSDGGVCFTSTDGWLYALNADGTLRWKLHTGGWTESSPALDDQDTVFVGVNKELWCVSADGVKKWSRSTGWPTTGSPALTENRQVYVASRISSFFAFTADGQLLRDHQMYWLADSSVNLLPDGTVVCGSGGLNLNAMRATNRLATAGWPLFRGNAQRTGARPTAAATR